MPKSLQKLYAGKLVIVYAVLVFIFSRIFDASWFKGCYIKASCLADPKRSHPIDSHVAITGCFFDDEYVRMAGRHCYDISGYFRSFFPLDMVFPIVYTLLMLSVVNLTGMKRGRKLFITSILIGGVCDYLENFSFALFLKTNSDVLATVTAFFTAVKTCFFIFNAIFCILLFLRWATRRWLV